MILHVSHRTTYKYTNPVFVEPHHLYFYPSHRPHIRVIDFDLVIAPFPQGKSVRIDAENNQYLQCWFDGTHSSLQIQLEMEVAVSAFNPYDFLIEESRSDNNEVLQLYLTSGQMNAAIKSWLSTVLDSAPSDDLLTKVTTITSAIQAQWTHHIRKDYGVLQPEECFAKKAGSCRDLSVLLIHILRNLQIPARFVSGYAYNPQMDIGHELHAWVEFYLSGPGWIGIDPSSGLLVDDHYVPVCVSHMAEHTLPVRGAFRGDAIPKLDYEVRINEL